MFFRTANCARIDSARFSPRRRASWSGSSRVRTRKAIAMTRSATAQTLATASQPKATMTNGARNFVTAAPTLPEPKTPSASPCWLGG
jgi:hypothetical protein